MGIGSDNPGPSVAAMFTKCGMLKSRVCTEFNRRLVGARGKKLTTQEEIIDDGWNRDKVPLTVMVMTTPYYSIQSN